MPEKTTPPPAVRCVIGIDSDGTVFDTMRIKHQQVFLPVAVKVWGLSCVEKEFQAIWEDINLYSIHRGTNRYQALSMAFERLAHQSEEARNSLAGYEDLADFVGSSDRLSFESLVKFHESRRSPFLDRVLAWSELSDELYSRILEEDGNPPYPRVRESLSRAAQKAEIVVVSSSSRKALLSEWGGAGLLQLTSQVAGQETGSKAVQLESILGREKAQTRALMIGDAPGDLEAAHEHGICFYPIIPGEEKSSWQRFEEEAMDRFFQGTYEGPYEQSLLDDFKRALLPGEGELTPA